MFAIALYDIQNQRIYLIRDFAGIKPCFTAIQMEILFLEVAMTRLLNIKTL